MAYSVHNTIKTVTQYSNLFNCIIFNTMAIKLIILHNIIHYKKHNVSSNANRLPVWFTAQYHGKTSHQGFFVVKT